MIVSITRSQADKFRAALSDNNELALIKDGIDPIIAAAHKQGLKELLRELDEALGRYDALRSGSVTALTIDRLGGLGEGLIEARIARGLSQKELGARLGLKEQQIQRYEQERYLTANIERLSQVADALALNVSVHLEMGSMRAVDSPVEERSFDPAKLPVREMKKRGWLEEFSHERPDAPASDKDRALAFVTEFAGVGGVIALHRKNVRSGSELNEYALIAWQARVLQKARRLQGSVTHSQPLEASFIKQLVELSQAADGPAKAVRALRERGVLVVFEPHLQGTHLDGAAMLLDGTIPVVGLTLRHDRLDNFWFTLLHEIGHLVRHKEQGLREGFFDDNTVASSEVMETEADEFAENTLIPTEAWKSSFVRFTRSADQVLQFARRFKIGESVVAGRIRRERGYHLFKDLVGSGCVKELISEAHLLE